MIPSLKIPVLKFINYTYIKILVDTLSELVILFLDQEAEDFGSVKLLTSKSVNMYLVC